MAAFLRWRATGKAALGRTFAETDYETSEVFAELEMFLTMKEAAQAEGAFNAARNQLGPGGRITP